MPTIIDALVTTFTLDASNFLANSRKLRDEQKAMSAEQRQAAKDVDEYAKRHRESFAKVAESALSMFAVFTAGKGIKDFIMDTIASDASLGRLAKNLNLSVSNLSAWERATEQFGGSAAGLDSTFQSMNQGLQDFAQTGQSSLIPWLRTMGVQAVDARGKLRSMNDIMMDLSKSASTMDRQRANYLLNQHMDQGSANLLLEGPQAVASELARQGKMGLPNDQDVKNAQALQKLMLDFKNESSDLGRTILRELAPPLIDLLKYFNAILTENHGEMAKELGTRFKEIADWVKAVDWKRVATDAEAFGRTANSIAQALGGWGRASELLFALWAGASFLRFMANIAQLRSLASGVSVAVAAAQAATGAGAVAAASAPAVAAAAAPVVAGAAGAAATTGAAIAPAAAAAAGRTALGTFFRFAGPLGAFAAGMTPATANAGESAALERMRQNGQLPPIDPATRVAGVSQADKSMAAIHGQFSAGWTGVGQMIEKWRPILDLVGKSEGTDKRDGYNETLGYGKWTGGVGSHTNLTGMTLDQIDATQTSMLNQQHAQGIGDDKASSALGRYQIIRTTLRALRKKYNLTGDMKFDQRMQDQLGTALANENPTSDGVSHQWASQPRHAGDTGGAYGQGTHVTFAEQQAAMNAVNAYRPHAGDRASGAGSSTDNSSEVHVGQVHVHTAATDAEGIAKSIKPALTKYSFVKQSDTGLTS
jgi:hypothetical protein